MLNETFIEHNFNLPAHGNELSKADDVIIKLKIKLDAIIDTKSITDELHERMYEDIVRVLDYVGRLSVPVFEIEDELERLYIMKYPHSPELAKKLWLDHYENVHHPYNLLKNRCFRMLDELDEDYKDVWCKNPPNWNI